MWSMIMPHNMGNRIIPPDETSIPILAIVTSNLYFIVYWKSLMKVPLIFLALGLSLF